MWNDERRRNFSGIRHSFLSPPTACAREKLEVVASPPPPARRSRKASARLRSCPPSPAGNSAAHEPPAFTAEFGVAGRERSGVLPAADLPIARSAKLSRWAHGTPPRGRNLCASGAAVGRRLEARRSFARPLVHPAPKITSACFVPQDDGVSFAPHRTPIVHHSPLTIRHSQSPPPRQRAGREAPGD
jgi:hypothetical protein